MIGSGLMEKVRSVNVTMDDGLDEVNATYLLEETNTVLKKIRTFNLTHCSATAQNELRHETPNTHLCKHLCVRPSF